ncbi:MAG: prolyl oligopeptidase family serine peptidase [Bacteroidota bacterium]
MKTVDNIILDSKHNNKKILLDVRWNESSEPKDLILFIHGFKGFKDWGYFNLMADYFTDKGFAFSKLNLSHNGTTPEKPSDFDDLEAFGNNNFSIELDDIGTTIDYLYSEDSTLKKSGVSINRLILLGHSRGGGLAILKTGEDERINVVAALAPIHNLKKRWSDEVLEVWKKDGVMTIENSRTKQIMPLYYQLVENTLENYSRLDIPNTVRNLSVPIFVAHGTSDETLPVEYAHELKTWNDQVELMIVQEGNHTFGGKHPYEKNELPQHAFEVLEKLSHFLEKHT